jgi:DNA-binding GntR family transcriptional regulator
VREAIRALGFLGLLEVRPGSGTYFRGPDQERFPDADLAFHAKTAMAAHMRAAIRRLLAQDRRPHPGR